jgi:hypothetical protein
MRYALLVSSALLSTPVVASAQVTTVDEGGFTITRGNTRVGHESFTIRRTRGPNGDVYVANGTVDVDAQRLSPALRTDTSYSPLAYQMEVRTGDEVQERLRGAIGRGRFSAQVRTPKGESTKEYIVSDGALIVDDGVFHQYYFLVQRARGGSATVPVVIPRRNLQVAMHVQMVGADRVTIAGTPVEARHYSVSDRGGARDVWTDAQGRVLKVRVDDTVATRDDLPH